MRLRNTKVEHYGAPHPGILLLLAEDQKFSQEKEEMDSGSLLKPRISSHMKKNVEKNYKYCFQNHGLEKQEKSDRVSCPRPGSSCLVA